MTKVNILWTGGWDSTYRVLSIMDKEVTIQPYYLKDNRKSESIELETIEKITKKIRNHSRTKCKFLELITMNVSDIPEDIEITNSFNRILKMDFFGSQYEWLARFAKTIEKLELTIHRDDKAFLILKNHGDIKRIQNKLYGNYSVLDENKSSLDLIKVFGNYHFPLLDSSKLEMKKWSEDQELSDIMNMTWFCHSPKNNQPCGKCNPCIYTIQEGLEYRFSEDALRRYRFTKVLNPIRQSALYKYAKTIYKKILQ